MIEVWYRRKTRSKRRKKSKDKKYVRWKRRELPKGGGEERVGQKGKEGGKRREGRGM